MFAVALDQTIADTERLYPGGTSRAYEDIARVPRRHRFERVQGSVYRSATDDLVAGLDAMNELRALPWCRVPLHETSEVGPLLDVEGADVPRRARNP